MRSAPPVSNEPSHFLSVSHAVSQRLSAHQFQRDLRSAAPLLLIDAVAGLAAGGTADVLSWMIFGKACFNVLGVAVLVLWTLLIQHIHGLYPACGLSHSLEFRRCLRTALIVSTGAMVFVTARNIDTVMDVCGVAVFTAGISFLLPVMRSVARCVLAKQDWWTQPVLIVGDSAHASDLYRRLDKRRSEGLRPLGIAFSPDRQWSDEADGDYYIGPVTELEEMLIGTKTCRVALADPQATRDVNFHAYHGIPHVTLATDLKYHPTEKTQLVESCGRVDIHCRMTLMSPTSLVAKRVLDLALIALSAPLLVPILAVIALLVKLGSKGPIFYSQKRIGFQGKTFYAWKFRSMVQDADAVLNRYLAEHPELRDEWERDHKLKNDPRVTRVGRLLRKTSLDEIPQLWNVVRGEMSLVGPRPIVSAEIAKYRELFELYTLVRPGITGYGKSPVATIPATKSD
ncbi:MAG: sugar transferase [Pirellulales bacterium]